MAREWRVRARSIADDLIGPEAIDVTFNGCFMMGLWPAS
jgi:hypothetical protein